MSRLHWNIHSTWINNIYISVLGWPTSALPQDRVATINSTLFFSLSLSDSLFEQILCETRNLLNTKVADTMVINPITKIPLLLKEYQDLQNYISILYKKDLAPDIRLSALTLPWNALSPQGTTQCFHWTQTSERTWGMWRSTRSTSVGPLDTTRDVSLSWPGYRQAC